MKQLCRRSLWFVLSLFFLCFHPTASDAMTVVMLSDTELIVNSRLIVTGRVASVTSAWDDRGSMVWTYVEIVTDRMLKGHLSETTLVLKQLGGTVGDSGVRVSGQPGFAAAERVLLYLNTAPDGSLHVAHSFIGKFSVVTDASGREFVERAGEAREVDVMSRGDVEITDRAPLDNYIQKIENTLQREATLVAELDLQKADKPLLAVPVEYSRKKNQSSSFTPQFVLFGGGVRWMEADSGQAIRYFVNPSRSPIAGGAAAELARAMDAWSSQSGAGIRLQVAGQASSCGISFDGVNTISFGDCLNQLDPPIGCAGVVGLTAASWTSESRTIGGVTFKRLLEADTVFNDGMDCFLSVSANMAEVACHELGHSIGLSHPLDTAAIMFATAHGHGRDATLGADDKAGVLAIYPASPGGGGGGGGGGSPVAITSSSMIDGISGQFYSAALAASGGTQPYRWTLVGGSLPPGLSISSVGLIEGVPIGVSSYSFAVQVFDSSNPVRVDARWLSITIRAAGDPVFPTITRVKQKGSKKLWVFGQNFRATSLILINGKVFEPVAFEQDGSGGQQLLAKGKLNLGPAGTNVVFVLNSDNNSAPFIF